MSRLRALRLLPLLLAAVVAGGAAGAVEARPVATAPKDPSQWQHWSLDWEATGVGRHSLRARATDAAGNVQPDVPPWNRLGYGNNAIEVSYVDVA